ncbi:MAG TPA: hypothetical protein VG452_02500 [Egibacteraceae bacterium]|nr:hypothetical protein [Actinomycetota bacterium]HWB71060.1 hypothetical protein [Egibacteraceae bacterium]
MQLHLLPEAVATLRSVFVVVEGDCEPWTDREVVRRTLIRGAMEYARAAGRSWEEIEALAATLRSALS